MDKSEDWTIANKIYQTEKHLNEFCQRVAVFPWQEATVYNTDESYFFQLKLDSDSIIEARINLYNEKPFEYIYFALYYQGSLSITLSINIDKLTNILTEYYKQNR